MSTYATLLQAMPWIAALLVILVLAAIGLAIWITLPRDRDRDADIDRQIATLRNNADHSVATRPRVRAISATGPTDSWKVQPSTLAPTPKHKPCGGGLCRHRPNCADTYCPGRMASNLTTGTEARHARH